MSRDRKMIVYEVMKHFPAENFAFYVEKPSTRSKTTIEVDRFDRKSETTVYYVATVCELLQDLSPGEWCTYFGAYGADDASNGDTLSTAIRRVVAHDELGRGELANIIRTIRDEKAQAE